MDATDILTDGFGRLPGLVHAAVHGLTPEQLRWAPAEGANPDRVVDRSWDPPVTLGVRLVSVVDDDAQHAGQAAYVRGLL